MASSRDTGLEADVQDSQDVYFDENLPDDKLVEALKQAIDENEQWWNSKDGYNLTEVREKNRKLWLSHPTNDEQLYEFEKENAYVDPRIFLSVETIISIVASRLPYPEVFPSSDSKTSKQLAKDLQSGMSAWAEEHQLLDHFRAATRSTILSRIGLIKLVFNEHLGKNGDIEPILLDPADVIVDRHARKGENPRFIAHKQTKSVEEWVSLFPESKDKIYKIMGIKRGVQSQLAKRETVYETWFTWYKDGKPMESVAYIMKEHVIHKQRHPHWIYEDEQLDDADSNVLDYPEKPFFGINHLNLGKHWIDDTTLVEQAQTLQRILEKRGRQLTQNADDAGGGLVLNAGMIDKADAARLTGDPQEKIMVDGDVRTAVTRIAPAHLPNYVLEDKYDARHEIDNVFATHAPLRGEDTKSKTLGQDVLQHQQDMTRHDDLIRSIEFMTTRLFRYVAQMMKVHYTEEHLFRMAGDNGTFDFVVLKNDKIEDGVDVRVKSGSTLPMDKTALRQQTLQLATAGLVDPLSLYETLQFPEPQKMVERLIKYRADQAGFIKDFEQDEYERDAFANIQIINNGMQPQPVKEPSAQYLNYYREYIMSGEFQNLPQEVQAMHTQHLEEVSQQLAKITALRETQLPTEDEIQQANQKELEMAQMQQATMGAGGQGGVSPEELLQQRQNPEPEQPMM